MTRMMTLGRMSWGMGVLLYVISFLLWSAVALRTGLDGPLLGLVWFGVPVLIVLALRWYWNRDAGKVIVFSTNNFRDLEKPPRRD